MSDPFDLVKHLNRAVMEYIDDEDNLTEAKLTFKLWLGGELFMEGDVVATETVNTYGIYLQSGKAAVASVLKSSYLDDSINGESWGDNPDGLTGLNNSVNGAYPAYRMVPGAIATNDYIVNDWDVDNSELIDWVPDNEQISGGFNEFELASLGRINPQVYVKGLIDTIWKALRLMKTADDLSMKEDFKRLVMYAARKGVNNSEVFKHVANFLPHITAAELLNLMRNRFNLVAFFNPYLKEVDYLHFEKVFTAPIIDWTDKFIRNEKVPPIAAQGLTFTNDGDDEDVMPYDDLEAKYDLIEAADYASMLTAVQEHFQFPDEYYKLLDSGRVFRAHSNKFDSALAERYFVTSSPEFYRFRLGNDIISTNYDYPVDFDAGVKKEITQWWFPENQEGAAAEKVTIGHFGVYLRDGASADVIVRVFAINLTTSDERTLAEKTVTITNTDPNDSPFNQLGGIEIPLGQTAELGVGWNEYRIVFEVLSNSAGTIAFKIGSYSPPFYAYADIDWYSRRVNELGRIANKTQGSGELKEYAPKGDILLNSKEWMGDYRFQMAKSDTSPKEKQKNFALGIYRGLIKNEVTGVKNAPFLNYDDVDIELSDYQGKITNGSVPDMTLRWHGDNGLMKQFWSKTITWWLHYAKPVRKVFQLSKNDLVNTKMWYRIRVKNQLYIINVINVKANADGSLGEATVDMYTL